jgi:hypothetical protein
MHLIRLLVFAALSTCQRSVETPKPVAPPKPVERFTPLGEPASDGGASDREAAFRVGPFSPVGPVLPSGVRVVNVTGPDFSAPSTSTVVLRFDAETYLAQVAPMLAQLDDANSQVWLQHPDVEVAYPVKLRDEVSFGAWLDEPTPGKVRVIQRADGFELQTNMGKLPGFDAKGPTVPLRGGQFDWPLLQKGLERLKGRFKADAKDVCFVPSYGLEMQQLVRAMGANAVTAQTAHFENLCLVYPRPRARDGG